MEFKVGDKVKIEGILEANDSGNISNFPFRIDLGETELIGPSFTIDGFYTCSKKGKPLQLVERAKQKVKKYKVLAKTESGEYTIPVKYFKSKEDFNSYFLPHRFVQLIQDSEEEFEE